MTSLAIPSFISLSKACVHFICVHFICVHLESLIPKFPISSEFKSNIVNTPSPWLMLKSHSFMLGWDMYLNGVRKPLAIMCTVSPIIHHFVYITNELQGIVADISFLRNPLLSCVWSLSDIYLASYTSQMRKFTLLIYSLLLLVYTIFCFRF